MHESNGELRKDRLWAFRGPKSSIEDEPDECRYSGLEPHDPKRVRCFQSRVRFSDAVFSSFIRYRTRSEGCPESGFVFRYVPLRWPALARANRAAHALHNSSMVTSSQVQSTTLDQGCDTGDSNRGNQFGPELIDPIAYALDGACGTTVPLLRSPAPSIAPRFGRSYRRRRPDIRPPHQSERE